MKFLIDECLSPKLVELAHTRGYGESSHIVWLGRSGAKDWELMPLILDGNWTLVTKNYGDEKNNLDFVSRSAHSDGLACVIAARLISAAPGRSPIARDRQPSPTPAGRI